MTTAKAGPEATAGASARRRRRLILINVAGAAMLLLGTCYLLAPFWLFHPRYRLPLYEQHQEVFDRMEKEIDTCDACVEAVSHDLTRFDDEALREEHDRAYNAYWSARDAFDINAAWLYPVPRGVDPDRQRLHQHQSWTHRLWPFLRVRRDDLPKGKRQSITVNYGRNISLWPAYPHYCQDFPHAVRSILEKPAVDAIVRQYRESHRDPSIRLLEGGVEATVDDVALWQRARRFWQEVKPEIDYGPRFTGFLVNHTAPLFTDRQWGDNTVTIAVIVDPEVMTLYNHAGKERFIRYSVSPEVLAVLGIPPDVP